MSTTAREFARVVGFAMVGLILLAGFLAFRTSIAVSVWLLLAGPTLALALLPNLLADRSRLALGGLAVLFLSASAAADPPQRRVVVQARPTAVVDAVATSTPVPATLAPLTPTPAPSTPVPPTPVPPTAAPTQPPATTRPRPTQVATVAIEPTPAVAALPPPSTTVPAYEWVSIQRTGTPERPRFRIDVVVTRDYGDEQMVEVFRDAVELVFRLRPQAKAIVIFGYSSRTGSQPGGGADMGRALASSDGLGWTGDGTFSTFLPRPAHDEGRVYITFGLGLESKRELVVDRVSHSQTPDVDVVALAEGGRQTG